MSRILATRRRAAIVVASLSAMASLLVLISVGGAGASSSATQPANLDHFTCYSVRQVDPTTKFSITLQSQFDPTPVRFLTVRTLSLCAPTSKNQGPVFDAVDHLECRQLAQQGGTFVPRDVLVTNQFGTTPLTVFAALADATGVSASRASASGTMRRILLILSSPMWLLESRSA